MQNSKLVKTDSGTEIGSLPKSGVEPFLLLDQSDSKHEFWVSNELRLYSTLPILEKTVQPGAMVAVGFDQGLDLLNALPQIERVFMVDICRSALLTMNAILEIGRLHLQQNDKFSDCETLL